ncbi:hypothetical protein FQ192_29940 [Pseudomonas sp. ANT_J12]|nr:hypothetical protein FQ192_29940 [Pseudomonas sp. ANT_J12]
MARGSGCGCPHRTDGKHTNLWRGGLPPLGREAAPAVFQLNLINRFCDCFAVERGQAPSPQGALFYGDY